MARFWENASGWEYDVLRLLPKEEAKDVCDRAFLQWRKRGLLKWWVWPIFFLFSLGFILSSFLVMFAAHALGLGEGGFLLAELVLIKMCYFGAIQRSLPKLLRPFVREQLYLLAQKGLPADHPLMQLQLPDQGASESGQA